MQTFLPYEDFEASARTLDRLRLGKQRVEAYQILLTNEKVLKEGGKIAWCNHPAVLMWRGYDAALCKYGITMCTEWVRRGYKDTLKERFEAAAAAAHAQHAMQPAWLGDAALHESHQSKLLEKNEDHYRAFFKGVTKGLPYVWPIMKS